MIWLPRSKFVLSYPTGFPWFPCFIFRAIGWFPQVQHVVPVSVDDIVGPQKIDDIRCTNCPDHPSSVVHEHYYIYYGLLRYHMVSDITDTTLSAMRSTFPRCSVYFGEKRWPMNFHAVDLSTRWIGIVWNWCEDHQRSTSFQNVWSLKYIIWIYNNIYIYTLYYNINS